MNLTVTRAQGRVEVTILQTHGDLDAANYRALIAAAQEAHQAGASHILLDLGDTQYMSSSGLVALQSIAALLRDEQPPDPEAGWETFRSIDRDRDGGLQTRFKLLKPQPRVAQLLEMVGFTRFLEVYSDQESAVASF